MKSRLALQDDLKKLLSGNEDFKIFKFSRVTLKYPFPK